MNNFKFIIFFVLFWVSCFSQKPPIAERIKSYMEKVEIHKDSMISAGKPYLSVFVGPGYTPESGFLLGGGILYTFSTNPNNPDLQRSSIPLTATVSTKGNVSLNSSINTFWMDDKLRVKLLVRFSNVNDDYFGVGYDNNSSIDEGLETSRYENELFKFQPKLDFQIMSNLFLGVAYLYSNFNVKETNPVMMADPNFIAFGPKIKESGPIYTVTFDSRDMVVNAYSGFYANMSYYNTTKLFGGNQNFEAYEIDSRFYKTINRLGNTLAFRVYGRQAKGDVPYSAMTLIGSADLLRGYLNGQYRDKTGLVILGEWRYMFLDKNHEQGKHGVVTWLGTGSVGNDFGKLNDWLPNAGVGYRFEVQPRMNVRIDFGVGKKTTGLYFNFSEAF